MTARLAVTRRSRTAPQRRRAMHRIGFAAQLILLAGLGAAAPVFAQLVPGDVVLKRTGTDRPEDRPTSVFPHWRHRMFFTCNVCHDGIFPMKAGETAITMDEMQEGKACGVCHNGRIAWGVSMTTCARCHVAP